MSMLVRNKFGKIVDASKVQIRIVNFAGKQIKTPCIEVCKMDDNSGYCQGCARSKSEIAYWSTMEDEEREEIIKDLPERKKYIKIPKLIEYEE